MPRSLHHHKGLSHLIACPVGLAGIVQKLLSGESNVCVHVKFPLLLSDFNQNCCVSRAIHGQTVLAKLKGAFL